MINKKTFCEECRDDINYTVETHQTEGIIKGKKYNYIGKAAHCSNCGSEVYVQDIIDFNLKALYNEYRKQNNIISLETILKIPEKYAIGKRPLSLLLGWGEQTFSRYCAGDIPTKQYSEILQKIYDNPNYYKNILEENKYNLKSESTYQKSMDAVNSILCIKTVQKTKIDLAISYLLNQCGDITPLALQKALYYIQGFYFAFYKSFLFEEDCEAWAHGPVYRDIYYRYRDYRFDPIRSNNVVDIGTFSSQEKAILENVVKHICCYSGKILEKFTHSEMPWLMVRGNLAENEPSERIIPKKLIGDYFNTVKTKYNMINPNDIKEYTQAIFNQI